MLGPGERQHNGSFVSMFGLGEEIWSSESSESYAVPFSAEHSLQTAAAHTRSPRHQTAELMSACHSEMMLSGSVCAFQCLADVTVGTEKSFKICGHIEGIVGSENTFSRIIETPHSSVC